ncbi:MAG: hypothetical protein JSV66_08580 [Trueperaceae bacterium]|nr:MAG: hypothetical protein JSV66_08580 [Trueperaceae bacterium]
MLKRTLSLVGTLALLVSALSYAQTLTFYTDEASFPGLPYMEDFEEGDVPTPFGLQCPSPLNEWSNNECFAEGTITTSVSFSDYPGPDASGLFLCDKACLNLFNNPSKNVAADTNDDAFAITFSGDGVNAVGLDLVCYGFTASGTATVQIFGAGGLLGEAVAECSPAGTFFGVISNQIITQIVIQSFSNPLEGADNVSFGNLLQVEESGKTTLCHVSPGKPSQVRTITVSSNAVDAHLDHGDTVGACP